MYIAAVGELYVWAIKADFKQPEKLFLDFQDVSPKTECKNCCRCKRSLIGGEEIICSSCQADVYGIK